MLLPKEIWKDIPRYEGLYQVSNLGKVRSLDYNHTGAVKRLKLQIRPDGYKGVSLSKEGKHKMFLVHRLVAQAFIDNPNSYDCVNHIDENKINNIVSNLEWCTYEYNNNYGTKNERAGKALKGRELCGEHKAKLSEANKGKTHTEEAKRKMSEAKKGKKNPMAKKIKCVELDKIFESQVEANEYLGKDKYSPNISFCLRRKTKSAWGYTWEYID